MTSRRHARPWQLARLRTRALTWSLRRRLGPDYLVEQVRYRYRGWNAPELDALADAEAALRRISSRVDRIALVGHSMGGRVAVHLAAAHDVATIVALAPWWPADDAALVPTTCRLRVLHGTADQWTDPESSRRQVDSARERGVDAEWTAVDGAGHFMLRGPRRWHRMTADFIAAVDDRSSANPERSGTIDG